MVKHNNTVVALLSILLSATGFAADEASVAEADIEQRVQVCTTCHGADGVPIQSIYPIIAGQEEYYLYVQLKDMKSGLRESAVMAPMVAELTKEDMKAMARYFSQQRWPTLQSEIDANKVKAGTTAAAAGQCAQCHLGGYNGNSRVPRLAGQQSEYLLKTMLDFKNKLRNNSPAKGSLMESYDEADIEAMAQFLASLTVHERSQGAEIE